MRRNYIIRTPKHPFTNKMIVPPKDTIKKDKQNGKYFKSETVQYGKFWRDKLVYKYRQN